MLDLKIDAAKKHFFDREAVMVPVERARRRNLGRAGGIVRKTARRSMRKARQKRVSELTDEERQIYNIRKRIAKQEGGPRPRRPLAPSKPGEPPRTIAGDIKKHIFYIYDPERKSVVVGPALLNSGSARVLQTLEEGGLSNDGKYVAPRPYMGPAYEKTRPTIAGLWRNSIRP